jgi:hypothetical protein
MDKLIIVGGRDNLKTLNSVDAVDLQTMTFTSLSSSMSTCRHGLSVALLKNALYAIGGHDGWYEYVINMSANTLNLMPIF